PDDRRHAERLEDRRLDDVPDLDGIPGHPQPYQNLGQQNRQSVSGCRGGRDKIPSRLLLLKTRRASWLCLEEVPSREGEISSPGEPLRQPPEMGQHVLGVL